MKKTLLTLAVIAAASSQSFAQNGLTVFNNPDGGMLELTAISPDGKYIAGAVYGLGQVFVADWKGGNFTYVTATPDETGEIEDANINLYKVNNNGKAVGYDGETAITFDFAGDTLHLETPGIAKDLTNDGAFCVGNCDWDDSYYTHACYWNNGVKTLLPEPTDAWATYTVNGTSAEYVSDDSTIIVGYGQDDLATYPMLIWTRNRDNNTYSVDVPTKRFFEPGYGDRPYYQITPGAMSKNGTYVALSLETADGYFGVGRYNTELDSLEVYKFDGSVEGQETGCQLFPFGVANDGTMIIMSQDDNANREGYIWYNLEDSKVQKLAEAFPKVTQFADFDSNGMHTPSGISADGRYIAGFATDAEGNLISYVFDVTGITDGVKNITDNAVKGTATRYTLDGVRINHAVRGINIVKDANGKVRKTVVK